MSGVSRYVYCETDTLAMETTQITNKRIEIRSTSRVFRGAASGYGTWLMESAADQVSVQLTDRQS